MILGLSLPAFTLLHVILSLVGIGAGFVSLWAMANRDRVEGWTALFLATTILTSVTGFMFPFVAFGPPHAFGIISLLVLIPAVIGRYVHRMAGRWRLIYVAGAAIALYLNSVVAIVQFFGKFSFLRPLAPTQTEPPFLVAQAILLVVVVSLAWLAARGARPGSPALA